MRRERSAIYGAKPGTAAAPGRMPSFIAVGPPRTATTWLHVHLMNHVCLPKDKETQFFVWNYKLGLDWYTAHFRGCPPGMAAGEIAPTYFDSDDARNRIAHHIPNCRIICTFRDPVDRLYSHYKAWRQLGRIKADFDYVASNHRQLLGFNRYAFHLKEWKLKFDPHVLVFLYDDMIADPQNFIDQVCDFIGAPRIDLGRSARPVSERIHTVERQPKSQRLARRGRQLRDTLIRFRLYGVADRLRPVWRYCAAGGEPFPPIGHELEHRIRESWRPEIEALEEMIGRDLGRWKETREIRAAGA
ncbi:MAG: sulfotransferase family protein [Candidatus Binataceae bacterium]